MKVFCDFCPSPPHWSLARSPTVSSPLFFYDAKSFTSFDFSQWFFGNKDQTKMNWTEWNTRHTDCAPFAYNVSHVSGCRQGRHEKGSGTIFAMKMVYALHLPKHSALGARAHTMSATKRSCDKVKLKQTHYTRWSRLKSKKNELTTTVAHWVSRDQMSSWNHCSNYVTRVKLDFLFSLFSTGMDPRLETVETFSPIGDGIDVKLPSKHCSNNNNSDRQHEFCLSACFDEVGWTVDTNGTAFEW